MPLPQAEEFNPNKALYLIQPKGFTVLNSSPIARDLTWAGNTVTVPPRDQIVEPHPKYPNDPTVPHSAQYEGSDEFIPGTILVQDTPGRKERYGMDAVDTPWLANIALRGALGVDVHNNITGVLFDQGLTVLGQNPDKATVLKADHAGRERWRRWQLKNASSVIATFEKKNDNRRSNHLSPIPPNEAVLEAQRLLSAEDSKFRTQLRQQEEADAKALQSELKRTAEPQPVSPTEADPVSVAEQIVADPSILMDPNLRRILSEEFTIRKRRVPKSQQVRRQLKEKAKRGKKARSAAIQVPED